MELSQAQKDLIHGLKIFGCDITQVTATMAQLWHPDDTTEMLLYMVNNIVSTPEELWKVSSEISAKRRNMSEIDEEE